MTWNLIGHISRRAEKILWDKKRPQGQGQEQSWWEQFTHSSPSKEGCLETIGIQLRISQRQERLIMTEGSEVCRERPRIHWKLSPLPIKTQTCCSLASLPLVLKLQSVSPHSHCSVKLYIHSLATWYSSTQLCSEPPGPEKSFKVKYKLSYKIHLINAKLHSRSKKKTLQTCFSMLTHPAKTKKTKKKAMSLATVAFNEQNIVLYSGEMS